jgi:hypothetical protein
MLRLASALLSGFWHDGLSPEELDQQQHTARVHRLAGKDRRGVWALVICFTGMLVRLRTPGLS